MNKSALNKTTTHIVTPSSKAKSKHTPLTYSMTYSRQREGWTQWFHGRKRKHRRNLTHCGNDTYCIKTQTPNPSLSCKLHVSRCLNFNKNTGLKAFTDVIWHSFRHHFIVTISNNYTTLTHPDTIIAAKNAWKQVKTQWKMLEITEFKAIWHMKIDQTAEGLF